MKSLPGSYSLYIHVPFCRQACSYCDFYFVTRQQLIPDYVDALISEIAFTARPFRDALSRGLIERGYEERTSEAGSSNESAPSPALTSIYFGGGTPSRLPAKDIARIMETITAHHGTDTVREVTLETNPDDVTSAAYLKDLISAGVTRLSMGIQSFDPELLRFMNRAHTADEARNSLKLIQKAGFKTFTADLIYGNPGQSPSRLEKDIQAFLEFDPPHISAYALTIEPGTRLGKYARLGRLEEPDDELVSEHMQLVAAMLDEAGIRQYEVSNFARNGHEAVHNAAYWRHQSYLGVGPAAHSLLLPAGYESGENLATMARQSSEPGLPADAKHMESVRHASSTPGNSVPTTPALTALRWENERDLKQYIQRWSTKNSALVPRFDGSRINAQQQDGTKKPAFTAHSPNLQDILTPLTSERLDHTALAEERLLMGLRTRAGVTLDELRDVYQLRLGTAQIKWLHQMGEKGLFSLAELDQGRLQLTRDGLRLADRLTLELLTKS